MKPNPSYMDSPKRKRLINSLARWEIPAVVYPASKVDSAVVRAALRQAQDRPWNLRHRCANRYKRQASCRKSYRRLSVCEVNPVCHDG